MYSNISNVLMGGFDGLIDDLAGHLAKDLNVDLKDIKKSLASFGGGTKSSYVSKDNGIKGIVIVKDYTSKSHAIFGETKQYKDSIIADINKAANKKLLSYNEHLAFGPGWVIIDKSKLDTVKNAFEKAKVDVQITPLSEFEKEHPPKKFSEEKKEDDESKSEDPEPKAKSSKEVPKKPKKSSKDDDIDDDDSKKPKKVSKSKKEDSDSEEDTKKPKKEEKKSKVTFEKNEWDNCVDSIGYVYMDLPIGVNSRSAKVVVGKQDSDADEYQKLLDSVIPLTKDDIEELTEMKVKYLTEDITQKIKKSDVKLFKKLDKLVIDDDDD
jgi:hypothetical protein